MPGKDKPARSKTRTGTRAANGEGDKPKQMPDGRWRARVPYTKEDGSVGRHPIYGKTSQECVRKKQEYQARLLAGLPARIDHQTVRDFMESWLEDTVRPNLRPSTYASYSALTRKHIIPALGSIELAKLSPQQVQAFRNQKLSSGKLSPRTVEYMIIILRIALNLARKWEIVNRNVASLVDLPRRSSPERPTLDKDQLLAFLESAKGDRLLPLYALTISLGLRRGEVLALHWDDVDLEQGTLRVRQSLQRVAGKLSVTPTKTEQSNREVHIPKFLIPILKAQRLRVKEERVHMASRWVECNLVFPNTIGKYIEPRRLDRWFHAALEKAKLPRIHFHDLRHSAATLLIEEGIELKLVSAMLGHADSSITRDIYLHVTERMKKQTANKMDELLCSAGDTMDEKDDHQSA